MKNDISKLVDFWKSEISDHIKEYVPYQVPEQLHQMASLFSPGAFYFYILNFQTLNMDYVSDGTLNLLKIPPTQFSVSSVLEMLPPDELQLMEKKEAMVLDFFTNFIPLESIQDYKVVYFLPLIDAEGKERTLLHQVTTLTVSPEGKIENVLGIHTDISHFKGKKNDNVSFINIKGGPSYHNHDPSACAFDPDDGDIGIAMKIANLSKREIEVVTQLAKGKNTHEIASNLNISYHTIRTHRKHLLEKTSSANMAELVARCMADGVI